MAVINGSKRYAASSEQQKLLQRNISAQAGHIRTQLDREEVRKRQAKLDRLAQMDAVLNPHKLDSFIGWCHAAVERAEQRASWVDLESILAVERVLEVR
jgi:hypothetical protein